MNIVVSAERIPQIDVIEREIPAYDARRLTLDNGQARIILDGQIYSLRITRANKLILTK
ncbi:MULTISPECIES: hemin uptake protein HemP [Falsihalocynthiibacter]|uniref:hemin uptake protein HemP n=1 Tax=Falsihalocynthiibacter TaxID=2854182 RepID=UPI0030039986